MHARFRLFWRAPLAPAGVRGSRAADKRSAFTSHRIEQLLTALSNCNQCMAIEWRSARLASSPSERRDVDREANAHEKPCERLGKMLTVWWQ